MKSMAKLSRASRLFLAMLSAIAFALAGTGIAPEIMPRIFDPFFTTRGVGRGKGLGLPVALGIAQGLGGGLEVHSVVGQGTTATVTLPLAPITPG